MPNDPDDESRRGSGDSGSGPGDNQGGMGGAPDGPFPFGDPQQMAQMLRQFADMMSQTTTGAGEATSSGINWDMAKNIARHTVSQRGDAVVAMGEYAHVQEALRLADLWLNEASALPSGVASMEAWSRSEWVEKTMAAWSALCDPLASRMVESMGQNLPGEMQTMAGPLLGMVRQMGGMLVGQQAGQAIGELAREVIGSTDVGLPLAGVGRAALLPTGIAAFGDGLEIPTEEVRLYLAAREAAHHRLFGHVPWLHGHVTNLVEEYARGLSFDVSALEERLGHLDLANPEALQEALSGTESLLQPQDTPQQKASLTRLETTLALIEGWVSVVVDGALANRIPNTGALAEAIRRRRATGGPAEHTFATLVGLELRPRRLREAAELWRRLGDARGVDGRDAVWGHPDLMPDSDDLDAPDAFVARVSGAGSDDFDLDELARGLGDDTAGGEKSDGPGDGSDGPDDGGSEDRRDGSGA